MRRSLTRRVRGAVFDQAHHLTPLLAVESDGLTFLVPTWDQRVGRKLYVAGRRKEMKRLRYALDLLAREGWEPQGAFVDVGANIGTTCLPALTIGFESAVAVEPEPRNVLLLRANAALNGLADRLRVVEAAASDEDGQVPLALHPTNSGGHRVKPGGALVPAVRLDTLLADVDVGLLWIDAQGHERAILDGAGELAQRVPVIVEANASTQVGASIDLRTGQPPEWTHGTADLLLLPH